MIKHFFKTFLISILCGTLLLVDFSIRRENLGFHLSHASAGETVSVGGSDDMTIGVGFEGPITSDLSSTLTMVAISVIASRLLLYGKITPDIMAAAAGGLAFIAGDMMATQDLKNTREKILLEIKRKGNGDITDEQRQYILRLIALYRASLKSANTKKGMQNAAAAAFGVAAALALAQAMTEEGLEMACETAISEGFAASAAALGECLPTCSGPHAAACVAACKAAKLKCDEGLIHIESGFPAYTAMRTAPSPTCSALSAVNAERQALTASITAAQAGCTSFWSAAPIPAATACNAVLPMHIGYESGCLSPPILYGTMAASIAMTGITASTLVTAVVGYSGPLSTTVDTALFMPMRRSVMWGVLAGLSFAAASATSGVIARLEGDIAKLENLLNSTIEPQILGNNVTKPVTPPTPHVTPPTFNPIGTVKTDESAIAYDLSKEGTSIPCVTHSNLAGGSACPGFNASIDDLIAKFGPDSFMGPGVMTDQMMKDFKTFTNGFNGTNKITNGSVEAANRFGANGKAIMENLKKQKADFQKRLDQKKSKYSFADEEKKMRDEIGKAFNDSIKENKLDQATLSKAYGINGSGEQFASNVDPSKLSAEELKKAAEKAAAEKAAQAKLAAMKAAALKAAQEAAAKLAKNKKVDSAVNNEELFDTNKNGAGANNSANAIQAKDGEDISVDKSQNIFEIITIRYQKSAYPRLFNKLSDKEAKDAKD